MTSLLVDDAIGVHRQMRHVRTQLGENGQVAIPAGFRRSLGRKAGDPLVDRLEDDGLRIESRRAAVQRGTAFGP